jgi:hypothetical protein
MGPPAGLLLRFQEQGTTGFSPWWGHHRVGVLTEQPRQGPPLDGVHAGPTPSEAMAFRELFMVEIREIFVVSRRSTVSVGLPARRASIGKQWVATPMR